MANNISVKITADVADLTAKRAIASAEVRALSKDLNDLAKTAVTTGRTPELSSALLAAGDAAAKASNKLQLINRDLRTVSTGGAVAGEGLKVAEVGMAGVTRELIVLAREASRGNLTRMSGSATILAQRLGLLTPEVIGAGAAILALAAPVAVVMGAIEGTQADLARFQNDIQLTGNYAGLTAEQYEAMAQRVAKASNTGIGSARSALAALVASGRFTGEEAEQLGRDMTKFGQLTGESTKTILGEWVKMADGPTHYAETFNQTYHAFSIAQIEHIANLEKEGNKTEATAELVRDLTRWMDDQQVHMSGWAGAWHTVATAIDGAWESFKRFASERGADDHIKALNNDIAELQQKGTVGGFNIGPKPEVLANLERERDALVATQRAQDAAADAQAKQTRVQAEAQDAYDKSHATMQSLRSSALQARDAVAALHAEMAKRVAANPNDAEAKDYFANQDKYDKALLKKEDPGDFKKAGKGPDQVAEWTEMLHAQEVVSGEFFKDQTADELAFWQSKLSAATQGSKDWLAVQSKIYDASKSLAHQAYDEQLATLNDQLGADRDNWSKEQADWNAKLAFIKAHYGAESAEYKDAYREFEAAEREHQDQMLSAAREGGQAALQALKAQLDTQRQIRDQDAAEARAEIEQQARYSANPFAGVNAAAQEADLNKAALVQQLADEEAVHAREDAMADEYIEKVRETLGAESAAYLKATQDREKLDQEWSTRRGLLLNQMVNADRAAALKVQQAWHSVVDPLVSSTGNELKGLIEGTETWGQALQHIGATVADMVEQALVKMVESWIVSMITGQQAQKVSAMGQVATYAGVAGAAGVASMAAAPWPIDMGAPAFGAAMQQTALALGSIASFDVGTNYVPNDMIAKIHFGERIIPRAQNERLMAAVDRGMGQGGAGAGAGASGGDTHIHFAPVIQAIDPAGFESHLRKNRDAYAKVFREMAAAGT